MLKKHVNIVHTFQLEMMSQFRKGSTHVPGAKFGRLLRQVAILINKQTTYDAHQLIQLTIRLQLRLHVER